MKTKTIKSIILLSLIFCTNLFAGEVPITKAKQLAKNIYFESFNQTLKINYNDIVFTNEFTIKQGDMPIYYIFNVKDNKGFVIISAEDHTYPILAYSSKGNYTNNPADEAPAFSDWMKSYKKQIVYVKKNHLQGTPEINTVWEKYSSNTFIPDKGVKDVEPLCATNWDQGCYYNELCPSDNGPCGHVWAGCVATSMAQVMKYHNFPEQGTGSHGYNCPGYGWLEVNFGETTYYWDDMPNQLYSNNNAVATLMYHCGVSVDMQYGTNGSGAYMQDARNALVQYFNYSPSAQYKHKNAFTNSEWEQMLRDDLDASRPIPYRGQGAGGGHAFVCDGYQGTSYFHFNWGWSGSYNGYYYLNNLNPGGENFTDLQGAILGVEPLWSQPIADFSANKTYITIGDSINFSDNSTGVPTSWSWTFVGGTPGTSSKKYPSNIVYNEAGNYKVTLTVSNPVGSDTKVKNNYITVGGPFADFTADQTSIPTGGSVNFTDLSTEDPTSWKWNFGDCSNGSTNQNPTHVYDTSGIYTVSLIASNFYGSDTITKVNYIVVSAPPAANFRTNTTKIHVGDTVSFDDLSTGVPTLWSWTFTGGTPDTSSEQNPVIVYNTPGNFDVSLTVSNNYGEDTKTKTAYITVGAPFADFASDTNNFTAGGNVNFTDMSSENPDSWNWTFYGASPNTSTEQNPENIVYDTPGNYTVSLTATNDYGEDTKTVRNFVTVLDGVAPVANFKADTTSIIEGDSINFTDLSTGFPKIWSWTFEGATPEISTEQNPENIVYNSQGIYAVTLTVSNNYGEDTKTVTDYISVGPVGIDNDITNQSNFIIYPNPSSNIINIEFGNKNLQNMEVLISNTLGNIISRHRINSNNKNIMQINLSNLSKGIYFITVTTNNKFIVKKVSVIK